MQVRKLSKIIPMSALFVSLSLFTLAGCGSQTSTGSTSSNPSTAGATATACAKLIGNRPASSTSTAIGKLKSINGQTLVVTNTQGTDVNVSYSSTTTFTQETNVPVTSLKEGTAVRVTVTSDNGAYSANTITVETGTTGTGGNGGGFGGFGGGTPGAGRGGAFSSCFSRGQFGTPGAAGTATANFLGVTGTIGQINGNVLILNQTSGASYTVTITSQTRVVETEKATAAALKVGEPLTALGKKGQDGTIAATTIAILLTLPTRPTGVPAS